MLNLAGIDLVLDNQDHDAAKFIEEYINTNSYMPWLRPSRTDPASARITYPWQHPEPPFVLNRFRWPQGASRWAFGHFLATSDQLNAIFEQAYTSEGCYNPITLTLGTPDIGLQVNQPNSPDNTVTAQVYLLPPTPLSGIRGLTGTVQSLYIISVVDQRFFWYESSTGNLTVDSTTTFDDLLTMLGSQLGLSSEKFSWDEINPSYLQPSSMFNLSYQPCNFALDAIAFNIGMKVIVNYNGTVLLKNANSESARLNADFDANPATRIVVAGGSRFNQPI